MQMSICKQKRNIRLEFATTATEMADYAVPLDPETEMICSLYLFKDVQNSDELLAKVAKAELSCCLIKASLIADPFQVIVAANKAAISSKMNQLSTKSLYTEILFNLSVSKNISRALKEFGISGNDRNILLVLMYSKDDENSKSNSETIVENVKGEKVVISRLKEFTDSELIRKAYKIEKEELNACDFIDSVVSRIGCKDFIAVR